MTSPAPSPDGRAPARSATADSGPGDRPAPEGSLHGPAANGHASPSDTPSGGADGAPGDRPVAAATASLETPSTARPGLSRRDRLAARWEPEGDGSRADGSPNRGSAGSGTRARHSPFDVFVGGGAATLSLPDLAWYELGRHRAILSPGAYERVKRVLDVTLCLLALPVVLVVLAALAVAIRLDSPGPVFYNQFRTGRGGRPFRMFKLRTMVRNAEELKERYAHLNELTWPDFKITNDPRITRVGRFLRRTSLDELPQVFNVLRGEMSLVGPRPTSFGPETYTLWHTARLDVLPGLTGLWQISGRAQLDFDERLRLDIAYIRNRSLWLDAVILLHTVGAVTSGRGAA